jgi:adenosylcobinamide kinase / adenosylcobinamide-phosphate guanylyltransferase
MIHLVLGGARSGKSSFAESQAQKLSDQVIYIATASDDDSEMQQRIAHHQVSRPKHWHLIEEKLLLSQALEKIFTAIEMNKQSSGGVILIECLTLWLSNWLCLVDGGGSSLKEFEHEKTKFIEIIQTSPIPVILVSNEVGSGIVPIGELSRQFVDQAGWLNQAIAKAADQVDLVVAGLPLVLKKSDSSILVNAGDLVC